VANQHIRMISGGSCDTGDWSNGAGLKMQPYHHSTKSIFFFTILQFYCIFDQTNAPLSIRDFFQKHLANFNLFKVCVLCPLLAF